MAVDPEFVEYLKARALFATTADAGVQLKWGARAVESEVISCLALAADAIVEGARQLGFLDGPIAEDLHRVPGLHHALQGQPVTLTNERLGYAAGAACFVIKAVELEGPKLTELTVLRKLT